MRVYTWRWIAAPGVRLPKVAFCAGTPFSVRGEGAEKGSQSDLKAARKPVQRELVVVERSRRCGKSEALRRFVQRELRL